MPEKVPYEHIEATFSNSIGYLSNMAISIGQIEYGKAAGIKFDKNGPACWKCTILTGLDIDAAKNGCHPDLSLFIRYGKCIPKAPYLKFKNKFDRLRKNPKYVFDKLEIESKKEDCLFEIRVTGIDENIEYSRTDADYGTGINRLPVFFKEAFEKYKGERQKRREKCHPFKAPFDIDEKTLIEEYKKNCTVCLELYDWYSSFGKALEHEKNKSSDAKAKIDKQIFKTYDEEQAVKVFSDVLPELVAKLDGAIPADANVKEIKERINTLKWQFQPRNNRAIVLEKIIGNDFDADSLSGEERELICHFGQYGFKLLWHIVSSIEDSRLRPYKEVREEYMDQRRNKKSNTDKEKKKKYVDHRRDKKITADIEKKKEYVDQRRDKKSNTDKEEMKEYVALQRNKKSNADKEEKLDMRCDELDKVTKAFYEENLTNLQGRIYHICHEQLVNIIKKSKISGESKIIGLYELTEGSAKKRRFFWDAFSWKEIEKCVCADKKGI